VIVAAALAVLTALAWAYVLWLADDMEMGGMDMSGFRMIPAGMGLMMPATAPWTLIELTFVFVMWAVMMIGMMTPSVAPMLLIYARVGRQAAQQGRPLAASAYFAAGYLLTWIGFAVLATTAQWTIERSALLTATMAGASDMFGGGC
jgi:predicted metal-binding membrane protein